MRHPYAALGIVSIKRRHVILILHLLLQWNNRCLFSLCASNAGQLYGLCETFRTALFSPFFLQRLGPRVYSIRCVTLCNPFLMTRRQQVHIDNRFSVPKISSRSTEARGNTTIEHLAQTSRFQRRRSSLPHHGEACPARIANSSVRRKFARSWHGIDDGHISPLT
jgi:hypothetical protein